MIDGIQHFIESMFNAAFRDPSSLFVGLVVGLVVGFLAGQTSGRRLST
jgi:hypothetical protein